MQLRVGFEMIYQCPQPTPMVVALSIHPSRDADLLHGDALMTEPAVAVTRYVDLFGNRCGRFLAPQGRLVLRSDALINDSGALDVVAPMAPQIAVEDLPEATPHRSMLASSAPAPSRSEPFQPGLAANEATLVNLL